MKRYILATFGIFYALCFCFADGRIVTADGIASYYADAYNGKPTASGELYDMNAYTAAHKTLPFGSIVELTNLENGRKTFVRINDRGPFVGNRDIDVSKIAAYSLGMAEKGLAHVAIKLISDADETGGVGMATDNAPVYEFVPSSEKSDQGDSPVYKFVPSQPKTNDRAVRTFTYNPDQPPINENPRAVAEPSNKRSSPNTDREPAFSFNGEREPAFSFNSGRRPAFSFDREEDVRSFKPTHVPSASAPRQSQYQPQNRVAPKEQAPQSVYTPALPNEAGPLWRIQVGAFSREENALRLVVALRKVGLEPAYERTSDSIRVVLNGIRPSDLPRVKAALKKGRIYDYFLRQEK